MASQRRESAVNLLQIVLERSWERNNRGDLTAVNRRPIHGEFFATSLPVLNIESLIFILDIQVEELFIFHVFIL